MLVKILVTVGSLVVLVLIKWFIEGWKEGKQELEEEASVQKQIIEEYKNRINDDISDEYLYELLCLNFASPFYSYFADVIKENHIERFYSIEKINEKEKENIKNDLVKQVNITSRNSFFENDFIMSYQRYSSANNIDNYFLKEGTYASGMIMYITLSSYVSGYITKIDLDNYIKPLVNVLCLNINTWNDYFIDFNEEDFNNSKLGKKVIIKYCNSLIEDNNLPFDDRLLSIYKSRNN